MSNQTLLSGLNPEQAAAVSHGEGPLLVLAGAGSGKTRVLTRRLAWVVANGVPQEGIVALTFTNKAAGEMKDRVAQLLAGGRPRSFVGTFHSFGVRLLRRFAAEAGLPRSFVILDADDQLTVVKRALKSLAIDDSTLSPRGALSLLSNAKNAGTPSSQFPKLHGDYVGNLLVDVHHAYEKALKDAGALDFDDLLVRTVRLFDESPEVLSQLKRVVRHVLVDEYQDTNRVQARLVKALGGAQGNIFAVGDEDQSIYRWRGADVANILQFGREFPGARTVKLERNYRSTASILAAAGAVVSKNERRLGKTLRAEKPGGEKVRLAVFDEERDEAREIVRRVAAARAGSSKAHVAVLFRTNAQSRPFEDELLRSRIPYMLVGGTRFYERAEIKDALAYLRLIRNPHDDLSFRRVVNVPARGIGAVTLEALEASASGKGESLFAQLEAPPSTLTERARRALSEFRSLLVRLRSEAGEDEPGHESVRGDEPPSLTAAEVVERTLDVTGLGSLYENSEDPQDRSRRENLQELISAARQHGDATVASEWSAPGAEAEEPSSLASFLDAVTLRADADELDERQNVVLMTLHAAKGLEFDDVFLVGFEDGSLPHFSSREEPDQIEEERRLAYVGMTRARSRLTLSYALRRMVRGEWKDREPSPFLSAIPADSVAIEDFTVRENRGLRGFGSREPSSRESRLFPDYEGESQERPAAFGKSKAAASGPFALPKPLAKPAPEVFRMKRTPPPPTASGFRRGARVQHPEYGSGVVLTIEGSGDAEKLTVYFDRGGRRKFVARFSNLTPA